MKRRAKFSQILWIVTAMAATASPSWGQAGGNSSRARPRPGPKAAREKTGDATGPLSESDYRAFAKALETAAATGNQSDFDALIDWDAVFKRMSTGWNMTESARQQNFEGLRQGLAEGGGLTGRLVNNSKNGGTLTFLRTRESHGRKVVLIRMIQPIEQGGFAYFEFVPDRSADGKVRASDIYLYSSGEFISESLRRAMLPLITEQSRSFLDKLLTGEKAYMKDSPRLGEAARLSKAGKPAEALAILKGLSPETQKLKMVLLLRLQAAQGTNETDYLAAVEDFRKNYPNDAGLDLFSIDFYIMKKDFTAALKAIDRLDKSLGGDPYLNVTRAGISDVYGNLEGAKRFARKAIDQEPTLSSAYFTLVGLSLKEEKYNDTLSLLKEMDQKLHFKFNDLSGLPPYAGFVKSPQYPQWLAYLKMKDQPAKASPARQPNRAGRNIKNRPGMQKPGS
jgi:hypothetical protein